jgi:hypothetical protein
MADIGTLNPEQMLEQQKILRQQKMAEMLMQQGMQQPQSQMVSGRYVAPSIFQNLAGLANTYVGQRGIERADDAQLKLAQNLREQGKLETQRLMNTFGGRPAIAGTPDIPTETYETVRGTPAQAAIAANPKLAYAEAINMTSPQARALLPFLAAEAFKKPKWEKASFTDEKTGKTREGVYDANSPDPIGSFQIGGVKPEMSAYERQSLNLRAGDQAISSANLYYNTGMGAGGGGVPTGMPMGAPKGNVLAGNMPIGSAPQPATNTAAVTSQPQYKYNLALSPKRNEELAIKFYEKQDINTSNAKENFDLLKSASTLLSSEAPSSGRLSNIVTGTGEIFGISGEASKADAQLNLLSGALTMKQPRFEGPQGVLDVILYQKLAGDLGNPNIPIPSRLATIDQMVNLQKKYYPEGDWDSISTKTQGEAKTEAVKSAGKVSLRAPQYATNPKTGERIVSTDGGINWKPAGNN